MKLRIRLAVLFTFAALAAPFALGLGGGNAATASRAVLYRYAIHYPMNRVSDARYAIRWLNAQGFDIAGVNARKKEIEVITDDRGMQLLARASYAGHVIDQHIDGTNVAPDARYLNPAKVEQKLQALHAQYPTITRLERVGMSNQNRPVYALLVSSTPRANDPVALDKPSIVFDGMHHAREIMTSEIVMDVAEHLLQSVASGNMEARKIVEGWNVWVLPMLNVDGNNIVWNENAMWRKNAAASGGRVHGVDINRNYSYRWADCNGSSSSRMNDTYHGASAASEPETQALMRLWDAARPAVSLSYHSYSELVLYPFGCEGSLSSEHQLIDKVGKELATMLPGDSGGFYEPGTPWQILYAVDGDSMDYVFSQYGTLAYTFEVNQTFQPRYEVRQPTVEKHRKAWKYLLNRATNGMLRLKVMDAATGAPAAGASIAINTIPHTQNEKPFTTNAAGSFFKVLDPGSYTMIVTLANGRQKMVQVAMTGQSQTLVVQVP
ncbi:MAG TPA: M14 family zinc carboxypeptidase [Bdellovibrionota bacterium]|nr:M14 family zinc carboxypeptidase [Bdellovibrionota bacterium]